MKTFLFLYKHWLVVTRRSILVVICLTAAFRPMDARACDLLNCDIPAELKILEAKGQNFRFQFISKMRSAYSKEKEEQKLSTLLALAKGIVEVVRQANDEDYVLREAKNLKDQTLFLLIQWVWRDCKRLDDAYSELGSEAQRFAVIDFFVRKIPEFNLEVMIRDLVCFAHSAEKTSRKLGDPDYISRHASGLASGLSTQLLEVFNGWEGSFDLTAIEGPLVAELERLKLILFSSNGDLGIVAALSHPDLPALVFQNVSFSGEPQKLSSRQSFASQVPSVIEMKFDQNFTSLTGSILDAVELKKVTFSARRAVAIASIAKSPCSEDELLGQYKTHFAGFDGIFSVQKIGALQYAGVFSSPRGEFRFPFSFGRYNSVSGRLTFINMQANIPVAWRLVAEKLTDNRCELRGWGLSTFNSSVYKLDMKRR